MPVKNNYQIKLYHGNSQARIFNFPFRCFSLDDLVVEYIDVDGNVRELVQNTEYSVRGGLDNSGGMITYPLAPEELPLGPHEAIRISRCTPMSQEIDYPSYQQAIENALDKTAMIVQEAVGSNAIDIANEAVLAALEAVADVAEKVDRDGSNIDRIPFLSALKIGSSGEIDLSDLTLTDGSNADPDAFRSLVGMPEIEANISDVESEVGSQGSSIINIDSRVNILEDNPSIDAIRPQTIVKGAVGAIPAGWKEDWCDKPAEHLEVSTVGSATLIVKSGLQVCAGYEGTSVLSNMLDTDITVDITGKSDGVAYIYANLGDSGDISIGYNDEEPEECFTRSYLFQSVLPPFIDSNTLEGYGTVSASTVYSTSYEPYEAFNHTGDSTEDGWISANGVSTAWIRYVGYVPNVKIIGYRIQSGGWGRYPVDWDIKVGVAGTPDEVVHSVLGSPAWEVLETREFMFDKPIEYSIGSFEFNITKKSTTAYTEINRFELIYDKVPLADFYDTASHAHYDKDGNSIKRVYLGECEISSGSIVDVVNYQHGTVVTLPVNDGLAIGVSQKHYLDKPFLGYCRAEVRIYHESQWGIPGTVYNDHGVRAFITNDLYVQSGANSLTFPSNAYAASEFTTAVSSAPAKVTVERSW